MRLTLRNLLAYMHGMMSSEDAVAFGKLVASSERVRQLLERCEQLEKRADLASPAWGSTSDQQGADAVSRYLDFSLADAELPAFERAALDSDERLAEIVACHKVMADVVAGRVDSDSPRWKERIIALRDAHQQEKEELEMAGVGARATYNEQERELGTMNRLSSIERDEQAMQDSGDLSSLLEDELDEDDDDDELSLEAAERRARQHVKDAMAVAANAYVAKEGDDGHVAAPLPPKPSRITNYGVRDPFKKKNQAPVIPAAMRPAEKAKTPPAVLLGGVGGVLALVAIAWMGMSLLSGEGGDSNGQGNGVATSGPHIYGIQAAPSEATCDMQGTIKYDGLADIGALVLAWPVGAEPNTPMSANQLLDYLKNKRQSPYNQLLIGAVTDDNGRYHMRMQSFPKYHVMVLSKRGQTSNPNTWGDAAKELQTHIEDPPSLIGQSVYHYQTIDMPDSRELTFDHPFEAGAD